MLVLWWFYQWAVIFFVNNRLAFDRNLMLSEDAVSDVGLLAYPYPQ